MTHKNLSALLLLLTGFAVVAPACGQIEVSAGAAQAVGAGASGAPEPAAGGGGGEPVTEGGSGGAARVGGAGGEGAMCSPPDDTSWLGCFPGEPCYVCSESIAKYPIYLLRHPKCTSYYACDHSARTGCSSDCPKPTAADQCDGTLGNWKGCRGLGCWVCAEMVADYPGYFTNHPYCISNSTCEGAYFTCSAACPAPTDADR